MRRVVLPHGLNFDIFPDKTLPPEILMNEIRRKFIPCENEQVFCLSNKNIKVLSIIEANRGRNYYVTIKSELFNRSIKDVILSVNCITEMLSLINLEHQGLTIIQGLGIEAFELFLKIFVKLNSNRKFRNLGTDAILKEKRF